MKIDQLQTPCYVIDEKKLRENLEILEALRKRARLHQPLNHPT